MMINGRGVSFWGTAGGEGCGQEPPPLIGAALLPSAGTVASISDLA